MVAGARGRKAAVKKSEKKEQVEENLQTAEQSQKQDKEEDSVKNEENGDEPQEGANDVTEIADNEGGDEEEIKGEEETKEELEEEAKDEEETKDEEEAKDEDEETKDEEEAKDEDEEKAEDEGGDGEADKSEEKNVDSGNDEEKAGEEPEDPDFKIDEILQTKIKLSDETECLVFSRGPRYQDIWPINCHLCSVSHILNAAELKKHINDSAHQGKLTAEQPPDAETFRKPLIQPFCKPLTKLNNPIKIYPGETVEKITPDLYERLQKVEEFEFRKPSFKPLLEVLEDEPIHDYNENAPILGLCYILKFKGLGKNPAGVIDYYCLLCRKLCSGEAYQHLVGTGHQMKYITKHFPNLYKKVKKDLDTVKPSSLQEKHIRSIFRKIYRKFEELRGFRKIHIILFKDYKIGRKEDFKKFQFRKLVHYDETMLEIPEEDLKDWIEKCKKGEVILEPDPATLKESKKSLPVGKKRRPGSPGLRNSPSRKIAREERAHLDDTPNNWDRYRRMLGAALDDLDREFERYEEVPERHPDYDNEWRRYWRRRSKELERDNIDPSYYDFKPEWLDYWADLLKDMHKKEVARSKFEIKRKLRLPYDKHSPSPIRRRRSRSPARPHSRPRRRTPSPEPPYRERRRYSRSPRRSYDHARSRHEDNAERSYVAVPPEPLGVISVLRQLTVLEDQLGSLGPKALEYLSRAVLFEKERNKPADELMREKEFYVFFVTAKEKLKGQLIANIVERSKIKAASNAVNDLETLLNMYDDYMRQQSTGRNMFTGGNMPPPMYMGNQMEDMRPSRNVFDPPNNPMNTGRRMPRQMGGMPPQRNQYNPPPNMPSNDNADDDDMLEAPPPPRNLFNVQNESRNDNQNMNAPMENVSHRHNPYNPPGDVRGNKRNPMSDSSSMNSPYGDPMNDPRSHRNMGNPSGPSGPYQGGPPARQQYSGGKGGIWQSGANQNFRNNDDFNNPPYVGGNNFQPPGGSFPGGMGMMNHPGMGGGRGRGGGFGGAFRGRMNQPRMNVGNNSFRGGMNHGFNN